MGQQFIDKVRAIVLKNISNEKFGVGELASELGLSKSQTLRKIKAAASKSANQYIRELRLEKAAKLIKKTDNGIAEISYQVGFSSPSYFNKAFSKYYGIAPGEYKTKSANLSELKATQTDTKKNNSFSNKIVTYALSAVLIFVVGYFVITTILPKNDALPNSIAVLPFKDLSPEDTQWFSDGVSDNILHSLAQMDDVAVTSFTSSSTYRKTDKQIPEIAKELGVSYILEGSVTLVNNEIKIITQLIDANDQHVWSKEYNDNFDNVITVQNNVAREVMQQLKTTLSKEEKTILKKYPTENMEAYYLYLEGKSLNQSREWEDLKKITQFNKKAIELDTTFAEAYAQIAATYTKIVIDYELSTNNRFITEALNHVDKALSLDPNSAKANAVKARLLLGNDWHGSENYFKKAIALNPNDAEAHYWYADYYLKTDEANIQQALKHITIANQLSPFSSVITTKYAWLLILNEKFEEADQHIKDYGFLMLVDDQIWLNVWSMAFKNKDWKPVFDSVKQLIIEDSKNAGQHYRNLAEGYDQIFIDRDKSKVYAKKAFELDTEHFWYYFENLTKNGHFNDVEQVMQTDFFKSLPNPDKIWYQWQLYYYKEDYKQAVSIINAHPEYFNYNNISTTYAQLGNRKKLDSLNKVYFVHGEYKYFYKAYVNAILKDRDSMYFYLNKVRYSFRNTFTLTNAAPEFEPYKNDKRYKDLLREFYIPISGE